VPLAGEHRFGLQKKNVSLPQSPLAKREKPPYDKSGFTKNISEMSQ
jgi:hypothetical protein